jgi:hypothetical protein
MRGARRRFHRGSCERRSDLVGRGESRCEPPRLRRSAGAGRQRKSILDGELPIEKLNPPCPDERGAARAPVGDGRRRTSARSQSPAIRIPAISTAAQARISAGDESGRPNERRETRDGAGQGGAGRRRRGLAEAEKNPRHQEEKEPFGKQRDVRPNGDAVECQKKPGCPGRERPEPDSGERGDLDTAERAEESLRDGSPGASPEEPEDAGQEERVARPVRRRRRPPEISGGNRGGPGDVFERSSWGARNRGWPASCDQTASRTASATEKTTMDRAIGLAGSPRSEASSANLVASGRDQRP